MLFNKYRAKPFVRYRQQHSHIQTHTVTQQDKHTKTGRHRDKFIRKPSSGTHRFTYTTDGERSEDTGSMAQRIHMWTDRWLSDSKVCVCVWGAFLSFFKVLSELLVTQC